MHVGLYKGRIYIFDSSSVPYIGLDITNFKHDFQQRCELSLVLFKMQLLNHTVLFRRHPSKPEDGKLWGNFRVVKGVEIHTVGKTTPCRDNMVLSQPENCPFWGILHSSNQTLTLWVNRAAAVPGTAAGPKAGVSLIYWVCLKLRFTWGNSPSHSLHQLRSGCWLQGMWGCPCMYTLVCVPLHHQPPERLFLGYLQLCVNLLAVVAVYDSCWPFHWQLFGIRDKNRGFLHSWLEGGYALSCFTQAQHWHAAQLLVVNNSEEAGSLAAIPSQSPLRY